MAFVKFSRGLISTYNSLSRKDPDTLYLVYESNESENGLLYLGNKLISSVGGNSNLSLNDLLDVSVSGELEDGMLLQYNSSTGQGQWEPVRLADIISNIPSGGGSNNNIYIVNDTAAIQNPTNKDIAVVDGDVFIYNNGNWEKLTDSALEERITNLESLVGHAANTELDIPATGLYKDIEDLKNNVYTKEEILTQLANIDHLRYEIVTDISDIDLTNDSKDNTVYLVPRDNSEENNVYDEYFVIDNELEKIGSWGDFSDYIQDGDARLLTEEQKKKLDSLGLDENDNATILATLVGSLIQTIQDNLLIKSVLPGTFEVTSAGELLLKDVPALDLSGYVQKTVYESEVGDLNALLNRTSPNSTLVEEINTIKSSVIWQELLSH